MAFLALWLSGCVDPGFKICADACGEQGYTYAENTTLSGNNFTCTCGLAR